MSQPLTVADIMTHEPVAIEPSASVEQALHTMRERGISSILVKPEHAGEDWGIMTKRDIISKIVASDLDPSELQVREIMTSPILRIPPDMTLRQVSAMMFENRVRRLPVFDHGKLVGIVSDTDIFRVIEEGGWAHHH
ncbi:MAG: CBS domain-containing protein [Anaerolineae bacterium]